MECFKHILVDGWNAIHAHPRLARELAENRAEEAQAELSAMLAALHDYDGARITIVYDGAGADISVVRRGAATTFSEVYTPSVMTADEFIEQFCAESKRPQDLLVITRDNLLRLTASSFGAMSLTPESFFERAEISDRAVVRAAKSNNAAASLEWRKTNPFSKLDELAVDIESAFGKSPLISKRLKKKRARASAKNASECRGNAEHGEDAARADSAVPRKTPSDASAAPNPKRADCGKNCGGRLHVKPFAAPAPRRPVIGGKPASAKSLADLKKLLEGGGVKKNPQSSVKNAPRKKRR